LAKELRPKLPFDPDPPNQQSLEDQKSDAVRQQVGLSPAPAAALKPDLTRGALLDGQLSICRCDRFREIRILG
jgi:hypothetical protein